MIHRSPRAALRRLIEARDRPRLKQVSLRVPPELLERARAAAAEQGKPLNSTMVALLELALTQIEHRDLIQRRVK